MISLTPTICEETGKKMFPLEIRDVAPFEGATRLTGTNPDGTPNGSHTGGAWLYNGMVYKPLDCRPYANCPVHVPTLEAELIEANADTYLFPRNWTVETHNGRRFLVRKECYVFDVDRFGQDYIDDETALKIEERIRELNRSGWEINDVLTFGIDPDTYELFILDLSAARFVKSQDVVYGANDRFHIETFFEYVGREWYTKLRAKARDVLPTAFFEFDAPMKSCVYASFLRPMPGAWAKIDNAIYISNDNSPSWKNAQPHTWIVVPEPLSPEIVKKYELTTGYIPLR